jgi:hypothetical protein
MFDQNLVHTVIGGKDPDCRSAELRLNFLLGLGHGWLLLDLIILPGRRLEGICACIVFFRDPG